MSDDKHQIGLLLSKIALRDREAFEALYQLTNTRLFSLIYNVVKDEHIAADILQEGYVKLWYSNNEYVLDYPWAWLCQIMRNMAIDEVRKRERRKEELTENLLEDAIQLSESKTESGLNYCLQSLGEEETKCNCIGVSTWHEPPRDRRVCEDTSRYS